MTEFATRMSRIGASATAVAMARAAAAKAAGRPVISLTTGEPDFDTPPHVIAAAKAAMDNGQTRYTAVDGTAALKDAIIAKFRRDNDLTFTRDQVIASTGAKQIIFNAILALVEKGDEVIIPTPAWVSYVDIVKLAGGVAVEVPCGPEVGFKPSAAVIAAAITPRTKALILNFPSNPTGAMLSRSELQAIGAVLSKQPQILTITDDIYEHIAYDGREFLTLVQVCPDLADRVLTVNGVSKAYAMTGWRLGYAGGPDALIKALRILQSQSTTNPSSLSQAAAVAALNGPMDCVQQQNVAFARRRDAMFDALSSIEGLDVYKPDGAFYLFVGVGRLLGGKFKTEADFVSGLLDDANLGVVGGAGFGLSPYIRLSFAASDDQLAEAADRIRAFISEL